MDGWKVTKYGKDGWMESVPAQQTFCLNKMFAMYTQDYNDPEMTGKPEQSKSYNDRKPGMTGKPKQPESWNDMISLKSGNFALAPIGEARQTCCTNTRNKISHDRFSFATFGLLTQDDSLPP